MDELLAMTALEQAEQLRARAVSADELARLYLDRIERLDGQYQSFTCVLRRRALAQAKRADKALRAGDTRGRPFLGVPSAIKDLVPMRGVRTMLGSRAFRHFYPPFTGGVVKSLEGAGFVTLGKTATSELGALPVTEPDVHPPTRNPHHTDHTSGGSSGGAGAAVAAGLVPVAQGSDGGGSVRIPAAFCHLYGFKPSLSLLGNLHGRVNQLGMSTMGPLTRDVSDGAAMLDVMRRDHRLTLHDASKRPREGLKVRMVLDCPLGELDPRIADAVKRTGKLLEEMGHHVEEGSAPDATLEDFLPLWQKQLAAVPVPFEDSLQPVTKWLRDAGKHLDLATVEARQRRLIDQLRHVLGDADVMLSATVPVLPPRVGAFDHLPPAEAFEAIAPIGAYTAMFNLSWSPAASIPAGLSDGLPFGVQLGAAAGDDLTVLKLSRQLEEAMPWRQRDVLPA